MHELFQKKNKSKQIHFCAREGDMNLGRRAWSSFGGGAEEG
jgi:hypothetical protein